ncbi:jg19852 [Pararge aegeria aegeria]|uniref:Jg19852 protein n=1 Tax=Pararge aegeria aegeria TaxID=348720 RepID=A0A8S4R5S5_9NEOP|nr:jg19852 [Pararge aegeria aegeria]
MDVGVAKCLSGNPAPVNAALVDPHPDGQTTTSESRGAAGYKRPSIVELETPYYRSMPSCGRQSVDLMMMMMMKANIS